MPTASPSSRICRAAAIGLAAVGVTAATAGCGGSSPAKQAPPATTAAAPASPAAAAAPVARGTRVQLRSTSLGRILVDERGHTLYLYTADHQGHSACVGACARFWPPETTAAAPIAGHGVRSSLLGTAKGKGATTIVTYDGHPLYGFALDTRPGQTKGENRAVGGARFEAVSAAGSAIRPRPAHRAAVARTPPAVTTTMTATPTATATAPPTITHTVAPPVTTTTQTAVHTSSTPPPPSSSGGIPQNGGGDGDGDNSGGPSDGDGNV